MSHTDTARTEALTDDYHLSKHAWRRMCGRRFCPAAIDAALTYGRDSYVRKAVVYAIGRAEVRHFAREGIDLRRFEGLQVLCSHDGVVLTAYRNNDFRGLRPTRRRGSRRVA